LRKVLNEGQKFVDQFILDFTNVHDKKFDIDWIINCINPGVYDVEVAQLREMQKTLREKESKWIK